MTLPAQAELPAHPTFQRIQSAALETFAARGFEATGIRQIAELAEIPTSLLYHYSRSKSELLQLLVDDGLRRLTESLEGALKLADLPEERLVAIASVHVVVHAQNQQMARLMDTELRGLTLTGRVKVIARRDAIDDLWRGVIDAGLGDGVFDVSDPTVARLALVRMCNGLASWFSPLGRLTVPELAGIFSDLALGAVRAHREGLPVRAASLSRPDLAAIQRLVLAAHSGMPGTQSGSTISRRNP